uniref:Protein RDM1 n=1 Tax=Solanum tuberosum TaxID=4113 RepID=M1CT09_SOLTU
MKGAVSFGDQVEISSGDSSSSNTDDRKTESKWMKNTITVDQPVSEWDSEGYFSPTQLDMSCPTPKLVNGSASTPGTPLQPLPEPITS